MPFKCQDTVEPLFPSFLFCRQFEDADDLNKGLVRVLRTLCQGRSTNPRSSGQGGLKSDENIFLPDSPPEIQALG